MELEDVGDVALCLGSLSRYRGVEIADYIVFCWKDAFVCFLGLRFGAKEQMLYDITVVCIWIEAH